MSEQRSLFDRPPGQYPHRAGYKESTTSKDAADRIEAKGRARTLRQRCLDAFAAGFVGTADELADKMRESVFAIRPRVTELYKQGRLEHTGDRKRNESGATAHVCRFNQQQQRRAG